MVKAYLRYELAHSWGVITSKSSVCYDRNGKLFFTASLERVSVWDVKQATLVRHPRANETANMHTWGVQPSHAAAA
jgi:hypothetical protein